jgi:hypothetical protein
LTAAAASRARAIATAVRRQANAALLGQLLELGGDRGPVGHGCLFLFPHLQTLGEHEMGASRAAVDQVTAIEMSAG